MTICSPQNGVGPTGRKMRILSKLVGFLGVTALAAGVAHASLTGTTVTGLMLINGNPPNYFDPANGFVPAGYENQTAGPTVTISTTVPEYGYHDPSNTDRADFGSSTLLLEDIAVGSSFSITYQFTDSAFSGLTLGTSSDTFLGGTVASLSGTTVTVVAPAISSAGDYAAVFVLQPVPEPTVLAAGGIVALLTVRRRRMH
jgi:hypothetical protein